MPKALDKPPRVALVTGRGKGVNRAEWRSR